MPRISISFENSTLLKALRIAVTRTTTFGDRHTKYARLVLQLFGDQLSCAGVKESPDFREAAVFARDFTDLSIGELRSRGLAAETGQALAGEIKSRANLIVGMEKLEPTFRLGGFVDEFDSWGPEDKARVQALTSSLPCKAFASGGSAVDRHTRGRAAILAKLVEWRRTGGVAFLGFYTDGEEDGGAHDARDIFRIEGVIDLGELIEAFAMAAAGINVRERLDIAEAECAALAAANAAYRGLLDK